MANYLDKDGLLYFWQKIKNVFAQKTEIPSNTSDLTNDSNFPVDANYVHTDNNYTTAEKNKLSGIAAGAEVNQNAFSNVKVGSTTVAADGKTDTLELIAGSNVTLTPDATNDTVTIAATDTTYSNATTSAAGLMSSADKTKLDGIATGAQVNQDGYAYVKVKVGSSTTSIPASSATDQITFIQGSNVTLTPNASSKTVTIAATDTTYSGATTSTAGLMSAADKTKLDSIEAGAEVNQNAFSNIKVGSTTVAADAKTDTLEFIAGANVTLTPDATTDTVTISATDTTYSNATTSAAGLMSASDKTKLDSVEEYAQYNQNAYSTLGFRIPSQSGQMMMWKYVPADSQSARLDFDSGSNIAFAYDETNRIITVSATDTTYSNATQSAAGLMSSTDKTKLDGFSAASNYALKSDITGMYKYKGSVATASGLPSSGQTTGDVYNIEAASVYGGPGMNVAWNGSAWDPLGEIFSITSVTNAEIDTIVAS